MISITKGILSIPFRFMSIDEICRIFDMDVDWICHYIERGFLPEPYIIGNDEPRWRSDEIEETIMSLKTETRHRQHEEWKARIAAAKKDD